jgi:hypothetical protein
VTISVTKASITVTSDCILVAVTSGYILVTKASIAETTPLLLGLFGVVHCRCHYGIIFTVDALLLVKQLKQRFIRVTLLCPQTFHNIWITRARNDLFF